MTIARRRWIVLAGLTTLFGLPRGAWPATAPTLLLANVYRAGIALDEYWVSEKYDGVRGYWDGERLRTRGGETVAAPAWFTTGWPAEPLDGELWAGRGRFEQASATVRRQVADHAAWRAVRFMVFDLPAHPGTFDQRLPALHAAIARIDRPWVLAVPQDRVTTHAALVARMRVTVKDGGEGLMLHRGASLYRGVRSHDLLKVKPHDDAEARVVGHVGGRGRLSGVVGALDVEAPDGQRFRIGSGLTDAVRRDPPPVGSWVTYRFRGTHASGVPRFASYLRARPDFIPPAAQRP